MLGQSRDKKSEDCLESILRAVNYLMKISGARGQVVTDVTVWGVRGDTEVTQRQGPDSRDWGTIFTAITHEIQVDAGGWEGWKRGWVLSTFCIRREKYISEKGKDIRGGISLILITSAPPSNPRQSLIISKWISWLRSHNWGSLPAVRADQDHGQLGD